MKKVVVALSGGVDSAIACYLLKQTGYEVEAIFMQNWDSFVNNENYDNKKEKCDSQYEWEDAKKIAEQLDVKITKVDFIKEYWDYVFKYFLNEYKKGRTPNPDVLCNKYIKFGFFLDYCINKCNCDYIATGHYAKVEHLDGYSLLKKCKDDSKDQTYFLCSLNQQQLKKTLFPLENITKQEVRKLAQQLKFDIWNKKDSTGICFIGERKFKEFLENYIPNQKGKIVEIETSNQIGEHSGTMYYTIGQNSGLGLGGKKHKYFVCKKDVANNILYVCKEENKNKYLLSHDVFVENFNWIILPRNPNNLKVRFRHRQKLINCKIEILNNNEVHINCDNGCESITAGQYAVLYEDDICLGGGVINSYK